MTSHMPIRATFHHLMDGKLLGARNIEATFLRKISTFVRAVSETFIGMKRCISEKLATVYVTFSREGGKGGRPFKEEP